MSDQGGDTRIELMFRLEAALKRIEALEAALRKADTACFNLCVNHGFATGHGDTVAAMIEEIDAQISISDRRSVIELIHRIEALEAALRAIDKHLDDFGYGRGMKARKMIAVALFKGEE